MGVIIKEFLFVWYDTPVKSLYCLTGKLPRFQKLQVPSLFFLLSRDNRILYSQYTYAACCYQNGEVKNYLLHPKLSILYFFKV